MKGFCDLGDLQLRKKFKYLKRDPADVNLSPVLHPNKIIELIKGKASENQNQFENTNATAEKLSDSKQQSEVLPEHNNTTNEASTASSQQALARKVLHDKGITLVPEMGGFMVRGSNSTLYAVKLFPKESCQCPSTGRCYHILAARKSINLPDDNKNKIYNLSQLRKRSRSKTDKKSGRKKPRIGDLDNTLIAPAPDSILAHIEEQKSDDDFNFSLTESTPKHVPLTPRTPKSILKKRAIHSDSKKSLTFEPEQTEKSVEKIEIPKMQPVIEDLKIDVEMELSRSFEQEKNETEHPWIPTLSLSLTDKYLLLHNKKLNSNHMEAVNIITRKQFPNIQSLQLTEKVPTFIKAEGRWHAGTVMDPVTAPAGQILHTHSDHWVVSFLEKDNKIYVFDSLGTERPESCILTPGLQIQLAILYGKDKKSLDIIFPDTQRQNNSTDCGLFAIAHLLEFCMKQKTCPNVIFDTTKMRKHLSSCLETESVIEFPKTCKSLNLRGKKEPKTFSIDLVCMCNMPECLDDVVQCESCLSWFHKHCVMAPTDISMTENHFNCFSCSES